MKIVQIRPKILKDFQGKKSIKNNLSVYIKSSKKRNEPLDHCLFYGPPGVGKTSLAHIISNELNQKIKVIQGPEIIEKTDILNILYSIKDFSILFIDEIHAVNQKCFEILYSAMEDFLINIEIGKDFNKKITSVNVPRFTLIGATTKLGLLPNPFEERFGIVINISEYDADEIFKILKFSLEFFNIKIDDNFLIEIAKRSKGIPRIAKRILSRCIDYLEDKKINDIKKILNKIGVFEYGLDQIDLNYLMCLNNNKKIGLKTLCQLLNIDEKTIVDKIEPYLIKCNLILKTSNGRMLTLKGEQYLKNNINLLN